MPIRRCLGCGDRRPRAQLVRFVVVPAGRLATLRPDGAGTPHGRGLYTCPAQGCFDKAVERRAFSRAARLSAPLDTSRVAPLPLRDGRRA